MFNHSNKTKKLLAKGVLDNCYFNAYWDIAGPMISGQYNDYGGFILSDEINNNKNTTIFLKNIRHDIASVIEDKKYGVEGFDFNNAFNWNNKITHDDIQKRFEVLVDESKEGKLFVIEGLVKNLVLMVTIFQ